MTTYELMDRLSDHTRRFLIMKGYYSFEELSAATEKEMEDIFRQDPAAWKEIAEILPVIPEWHKRYEKEYRTKIS